MAAAPTTIQAGTRVSGRIEGSEDIDVFGAVEGSVALQGHLLIDGDARVDAALEVSELTIHGVLVGNATVSGTIELHSTARVVGDLVAPSVIVHDGAQFRGLIDMGDAEGGASARSTSSSTRRSATTSTRATASPARPATRRAKPEPEPEIEEEVEAYEEADEPEPELPEAAPKKRVAAKKRKK